MTSSISLVVGFMKPIPSLGGVFLLRSKYVKGMVGSEQ
jgi:hypothetical protein